MNDNFDLLISSGSVYLPNNKIEESDIGIKDSKILAIGNLQNNRPISDEQFPSMGCNIKWKS